MNLIKLYLRFLNIIPFFLFLPILIWGLNTENLQSRIPGIFYVYIVLAYVLSIRIFVNRDRLLIKDVTEIECLEDKAIVKTEKRKLEVFYNYLHEGKKNSY